MGGFRAACPAMMRDPAKRRVMRKRGVSPIVLAKIGMHFYSLMILIDFHSLTFG